MLPKMPAKMPYLTKLMVMHVSTIRQCFSGVESVMHKLLMVWNCVHV
jgi:hypothetical protein